MSPSYVGQVVRGDIGSAISFEAASSIASTLRVDVNWLLRGEGAPPDLSTPGERVSAARAKAGLTVDALAEQAGCRASLVRRVEQGKQGIGKWGPVFAEALNVAEDYLTHGFASDEHLDTSTADEEVRELIDSVVLEVGAPPEVAQVLRKHVWHGGRPSYGTLRSYAVDIMGQRSGKLAKPPAATVELRDGSKQRKPRTKA
jgi:transcriptional regulator with XRE-family HTH domain